MTDEMIIDYWKKGYTVEQIARFFPSVRFGEKEPSWQMINRVETVIRAKTVIMEYQTEKEVD